MECLAEATPGDYFALQELAELFEANRLWTAPPRPGGLADAAKDDPYRQCSALRRSRARAPYPIIPAPSPRLKRGRARARKLAARRPEDRLVSVYEAQGDVVARGVPGSPRGGEPQDWNSRNCSHGSTSKGRPRRRQATTRAGRLRPAAKAPGSCCCAFMNRPGASTKWRRPEALIDRFPNDPDFLRRPAKPGCGTISRKRPWKPGREPPPETRPPPRPRPPRGMA